MEMGTVQLEQSCSEHSGYSFKVKAESNMHDYYSLQWFFTEAL